VIKIKVKIQYKDKNLEIVNIEEYHLSDYCHLLGQRALSLLYQIEDLMNGKLTYNEVKHFIFDLSGSIQRLPENLQDETQAETIKMKDPPKKLFGFLRREE
jgi:hypothetical protein